MSMKRQADRELNHENWDQEDEEQEEKGCFKTADKEVLEKRVMRTAKRRTQGLQQSETSTTIFSGFGGFNKPKTTSFDFLATLTKSTNNSNANNEASASLSTSLFSNNSQTTNPSEGTSIPSIGGIASVTQPKSPFEMPANKPQSIFGGFSNKTDSPPSVFSASPKADSTNKDSPFKIQPVSSSTDSTANLLKTTQTPTTQVSSTMLGGYSNVTSKSLFTSTNTSPFGKQPVSSTNANNASSTSSEITSKVASPFKVTEKKVTQTSDEKTSDRDAKYYAYLKGLNVSVSAWIQKHVQENPVCLLTPIFKDYETHLQKLEDERNKPTDDKTETTTNSDSSKESKINNVGNQQKVTSTLTDTNKADTTLSFGTTGSSTGQSSLFGAKQTTDTSEKPATFSFGSKFSTNTSSSMTTTNTSFGFGATASTASTMITSSPFSFAPKPNTGSPNNTAPFSFGTGKPFSFNSNVQEKKPEGEKETNEEEDTPPKVEYTPVVEENSVYEKKCKVFGKKEANFVDKGVGTLYIKKVEDSAKHQLLVRANTSLGTVLLNLILSSAIPMQRMGKNNVMIICVPTPDAKPEPSTMLIRVKTSEEADELLEILTKYKT